MKDNDKIFFENIANISEKYLDWKNYVPNPDYDPKTHVYDLVDSKYFSALIAFRHIIKMSCDYYWHQKIGALNVDLFMMTPSVSSPMGPGSDSEAISIQFGNLTTNLVDSSQFGFEPILMNEKIDKVYCYLPSMRGEDPDSRHLNQFYHCEAEIVGSFEELIPMIEGFVRFLSLSVLHSDSLLRILSSDYNISKNALTSIINSTSFNTHSFDEVVDYLENHNYQSFINRTISGRDITSTGEIAFVKDHTQVMPLWVTHYDRDRVPFYQKPFPEDTNKVINGDLISPPLTRNSFGGEIVGAGQRQDNSNELLESLKRQSVSSEPYRWYIDLRDLDQYSITSGFGIGIERFIAWILLKDDIKDVIPYPRLKNVVTYP